ncbi:MAG: hypothetical protein KAS15_00360, partial [Nanoarchaeota archaeon]|nr:hypothetical protein [Nanoarchaeota archaeon]
MVKLPKLKKEIVAFLKKEDGKISKQSLIKAGVILSAAAVATVAGVSADISHVNSPFTLEVSGTTATGTHGHHASHSSHG